MTSLAYISQQVAIYGGMFILITGLFGGILNCVIFLSLRTFRETPIGILPDCYVILQHWSVSHQCLHTNYD